MSEPTDRTSTSETDAARRLDRAIDEFLSDPSAGTDAGDPLTGTALVLASWLPRLHPRFGFEERLARRLREEAAAGRGHDGVDEPRRTIVPFPRTDAPSAALEVAVRSWQPGRRSLIGAMIASGVSLLVTLVGAGFVIWRRLRADATEGIA